MNKLKGLYFLVLALCGVVLLTALGGGLFDQSNPWYLQWQHLAFQELCHQIPERSFWIDGQPMAVCSRCFGIYSSFTLGWIFLPFLARWDLMTEIPLKKIIGTIVLLNLIDIAGNIFGFWINGLYSRLFLGFLLGFSVSLLFTGDFFNRSLKFIEANHARI